MATLKKKRELHYLELHAQFVVGLIEERFMTRQQAVDFLNSEEGFKTIYGKEWQASNLEKFLIKAKAYLVGEYE